MKLNQCALQLYTLRDRIKTRQELETSLCRVKEIGYPAVQLSHVDWDIITPAEMAELCGHIGLVICATHEPGEAILNEPERVAEKLQALGCTYTAYPYPHGIDLENEEAITSFIRGLEHAGKVLAERGCTLAYHNHHLEFRRSGDTTILDRIYRETSPDYLQGEIDIYWVQYGGGDPVSWCRRLAGRLPLLHLKDFGIDKNNEITYREIGYGNLDFPAILTAAEGAGCQWFIVEQDECTGDEFASIEKSFAYIRDHLATS